MKDYEYVHVGGLNRCGISEIHTLPEIFYWKHLGWRSIIPV
jgi:hypothetical protein